ncbi:MAG TPA: hypothetical protein VHA52_12435, partial [Candidatus Babeliaceae bacterium]|nr:hypothetical protein [Candidatus Babeliaceae bacterium]
QVPGNTGAVFNFDKMEFLTRSFKHLYQKKEPFIDDTHYSGRVNIKIDALLTDLDAVNLELKKFGLEIVREPRTIDMLVIKDHK